MIIKSNVKRLLQYRLCTIKFKQLGFTRIYSHDLGNEAGVSPEQVRKDFSIHGITGNKKAGYKPDTLLEVFNKLFGMDKIHNVIMVGMGNIGRALASYNNQFIGQNVYIVSAFDNDPEKQDEKSDLPVYGLDKLEEQINKYQISTAVLTVPGNAAQEVCDELTDKGIKGMLNFTPVILKVPEDIIINNINLSTEIEAVIYYLNKNKTE